MKQKKKPALKRETRPTWAGFKPRKEATKKERLERAERKHKGKEEER